MKVQVETRIHNVGHEFHKMDPDFNERIPLCIEKYGEFKAKKTTRRNTELGQKRRQNHSNVYIEGI